MFIKETKIWDYCQIKHFALIMKLPHKDINRVDTGQGLNKS